MKTIKPSRKIKVYLLLISFFIILSAGIVFVESQCAGGSCPTSSGNTGSEGSTTVYWDQTQQMLTFEKIDPTTNQPRPEATGANMIEDKTFMETNWDTAKESQKIEYIKKTYPNLGLDNNPGNFRLKEDGSMDMNGKEVFSGKELEFLNNKNAKVTFLGDKLNTQIGNGNFKWTPSGGLQYEMPKQFPQLPKTPYGPGSPANAPAGAFGAGGQPGQGSEFQQALQLIQQIAGLIKELRSNGQGQTTATQNSQGGTKATLEREAALALEDGKGNPKLLVSQNDKNKAAEVNTKGKNNEVDIKNANIIVPEQIAAKVTDETTLVLNGIDGDDPDNPPKTDEDFESIFEGITITPKSQTTYTIILPLSKLLKINLLILTKRISQIRIIPQTTTSITAYFISGETIKESNNKNKITGNVVGLGGQYIDLENHDLDINGHDIDSYSLKTFNELKAGGQNIKFYSGESLLEFNNQQTLYNRLPKKIPYGSKLVVNKLDQKNKFTLKHYTNRLGEFTEAEDENKIISVGDITTKHPTKPLIIAKMRKEMWAKK